MNCCTCHRLSRDEVDKKMASGEVDEVCPDDPRHDCSLWPICPCDFTEAEAVGVLKKLDFEIRSAEDNKA